MRSETKIVEIGGVVGIGKSTLLGAFRGETTAVVVEPIVPILKPFLAAISYFDAMREAGGFATPRIIDKMEYFMIAHRRNLIRDTVRCADMERKGRVVVTDFGRPGVFARNLLALGYISKLDYETYQEVERACDVYPDLLLLLRGTDQAFSRIKRRAREGEEAYTKPYIAGLDKEWNFERDRLRRAGVTVVEVPWGEGVEKGLEIIRKAFSEEGLDYYALFDEGIFRESIK